MGEWGKDNYTLGKYERKSSMEGGGGHDRDLDRNYTSSTNTEIGQYKKINLTHHQKVILSYT